MRKRYRIIFVSVVLVMLMASCAGIKDAPRPDLIMLNNENFKSFERTYHNAPTDTVAMMDPIGRSLWVEIAQFKYDRYRYPNWMNHSVKVKLLSEKKMKFELFDGDSLLREKIVKGKIKDGYFYRKRKLVIVPFVPLWFGYFTDRSRFGFSNDKLYVDGNGSTWLFAMIAVSSGKGDVAYVYDMKVKEE